MDSQGDALSAQSVDQSRRRHRRSRIPLSCDPCRTRKLKCNREKPCQNCTARHEQASCKFRGSKHGAAPIASRGSNGDEMRQRIDHLEGLVKKLIAQRQNTSSPRVNITETTEAPKAEAGPASDAQETAGASKMLVDGVRSMYLNADDWQVVLQEINQLKRTWSQGQGRDSECHLPPAALNTVDGSSLLFNQVKPIEHMEFLSALPPKAEVDHLVREFFNRNSFPISVPRITMLAYYKHGEPPQYEGISESLFQMYRMRTAQCLLSGDISKCLPHTVETLRFNATAELNRKDDNRRGLWIMTGVVVRTAINMGYHLDPSNSPGISALQAEYRRRTWLSIMSMDNMASFLGGFPRMGSAIHSDTKEPRNLHDWELSEETTIPPASRPLTEPTPATYLIVKGRLFCALGRVADVNSAPGPVSYETVLEVDRAVHDAFQSVPPHMQVAFMSTDRDSPIPRSHFSNLGLLCMYHKGMCMLHRKFLAKGRAERRFEVSRDRCITSALALLDFQLTLQPSFYRISQTRQMLTLGAMILFLELELRRQAPDAEASPDSGSLLQALERSCSRWAEAVGTCDDARRVHRFLEDMLASFYPGSETGSSQTISPEAPTESSRLRAQFNPSTWEIPSEDDLSTMDFDWVSISFFRL
ncbi:hypothetical protein LA080_005145 [Diaporthe eres]|nr:hypothetical protein LA080_005145 [Diaporthe eres]